MLNPFSLASLHFLQMENAMTIKEKIKAISKKHGLPMASKDHPVYKSGPIIIFTNQYKRLAKNKEVK